MTTTIVELRSIAQRLEKQPFHPSRELALSLVSAAAQALASANGAKEVKQIHDKLQAVELLFKKFGAQSVEANLLVGQRIRTAYRLAEELAAHDRIPGKRLDLTLHFPTLSHDATRLESVKLEGFYEFIAGIPMSKDMAYRFLQLLYLSLSDIDGFIAEHANEPDFWLNMAVFLAMAKEKAAAERREALIQQAQADADTTEAYQLIEDDFRNVQISPASIDAIITDPPYAREYIPLYADLAKFASSALKDGGSLVVMIGQSYLPEILSLMTPHIQYYWICAYLTSGEAPHLWQKQVNTTWKPLLWFAKGGYRGQTISDVFKSDSNDKRFHEWGQSEGGMADIVERLTLPGQLVLDPFCGTGTTGIAARSLGRRFIGIDLDDHNLQIAKGRLRAYD